MRTPKEPTCDDIVRYTLFSIVNVTLILLFVYSIDFLVFRAHYTSITTQSTLDNTPMYYQETADRYTLDVLFAPMINPDIPIIPKDFPKGLKIDNSEFYGFNSLFFVVKVPP